MFGGWYSWGNSSIGRWYNGGYDWGHDWHGCWPHNHGGGLVDKARTTEDRAVGLRIETGWGWGRHGYTITDFDGVSTSGATISERYGKLIYNPGEVFQYLAAGEVATDTFTYTVTKYGYYGAPTVVTKTVTVTIHGLNDRPDANRDTAMTTEDSTVTVDVLANDTDADASDTLTVVKARIFKGEGTVTINADNTLTYDPGDAYKDLAEGESATVKILYKVSDGHRWGKDWAVVEIQVKGASEGGPGETITLTDNPFVFSMASEAVIDGVEDPSTLDESDLGFFDGTSASRDWLGNLTSRLAGNSVNAVSVKENGNIVFSAVNADELDGVGAFGPSDLIEWDARTNTFSKVFTGADFGLALGIDAVHIDGDGSFIFSVADGGTIAGTAWPAEAADIRGNQLWRYDPNAAGDVKFSLFFEGQGEGLSSLPDENIDAVYVRQDGKVVISITGSGAVFDPDGDVLQFSDDDLVVFDPAEGNGTFELLVDGDSLGYTSNEDLKAVHFFEGQVSGGGSAVGTSGDDALIGDNQANDLDGAGGNDFVFGAGGDDTLRGGAGEDILYTEQGGDTLIGGGDRDVMHGDAGGNFVNTFVYEALDEGGDTIINFDLMGSAAETDSDLVDLDALFAGVAAAAGKSTQELIDEGFIVLSTGTWDQETGIFTDGAGPDSRLSIAVDSTGMIDPAGGQEVLLAAFLDRDILSADDIVTSTTLLV